MASANKAMYRDYENVKQFINLFGFGKSKVFFATFTFKDNQSKEACASSFNLFRTYLNKKNVRKRFFIPDECFHYFAVWEEHKKGGWHLHLIGTIKGVSTSKLRKLIRNFLSVTSSNMGFIHVMWTKGHDGNGISFYMNKYLTKDKRTQGIRYVNYSRKWTRRVKGDFAFIGGMAKKWRDICNQIYANFPVWKTFYKIADFDDKLQAFEYWEKGKYKKFLMTMGIAFFKLWGRTPLYYNLVKQTENSLRILKFRGELAEFSYMVDYECLIGG